MIDQIARGFLNSPYFVFYGDEDGLILERGNYFVRINKVGDYDLDVWIEGPYGDSDVVLTSPSGLDIVITELFDDNWVTLGLSEREV